MIIVSSFWRYAEKYFLYIPGMKGNRNIRFALKQGMRERERHMLTREELLHMRKMSFDDIEPEEISDVKDLDIDVTKSKREKILSVLESGRNPYFIKSGSVIVKIGFASTGRSIEEALESLVQMKW